MELADFLLARIAEDEERALDATRNVWKVDPWRNASGVEFLVVADFDQGPPAFAIKNERDATHIARWDPAHVLAECEAKRDIVREHPGYGGICGTCGVLKPDVGENWPCRTLRLLSFPYIDHPDYRQDWRA